MDATAVKYCQDRAILVEAWSPLGYKTGLLGDGLIADIGRAHGKTPAQAALRFLVQQGIRVIPKSVNPLRQKEKP